MTEQMPSNEKLMEIRKNHYLPTANHYYKEPLHLLKAKGVHVWDERGNQYLDGIGGIVCISSGHNHPEIKDALRKLLDEDEIQHTSVLYINRHTAAATEKLLEHAPKNGLDRVAFTNSGSEANELAFLAVRQATGETTIIHLRHSYHGGTSGTLAACGHSTWKFRSQPESDMKAAKAPYCYRCPYGKTPTGCSLECAKDVEETIQTTTNGKIAGFIAEPIMGVGGFIDPPKEYFDEVMKIVRRYGGKYISDEVQTGVGRCGEDFLYTTTLEIDADVVTMAKGLGNGAAVGAAIMKTDVAEPMRGKLYFNTFGGDPYQTVQAKVNIDIIEKENLIANAKEMGSILMDGVKQLMKKHPIIGDVRGRGLMVGMELVKDKKTKEYATQECASLLDHCKDRGLLVGKGGLYGNVVRVAPPLSINKDHVNKILEVLDQALTEVENGK